MVGEGFNLCVNHKKTKSGFHTTLKINSTGVDLHYKYSSL